MAKIPMGVRVPPELMEFIENEVSETGNTKADIVIETLWQRYNGVSQKVNDFARNDNSASNDGVIDVYGLVLDGKDKHISFLEKEILEKNEQIHKFQVTQQTYMMRKSGLIGKIVETLGWGKKEEVNV